MRTLRSRGGRLLACAGCALSLCLLLAVPALAQGGEHRAALVMRFADGSVQTRCVAFSEPSLSGQQLLVRSGFPIIVNPNGAFGGAVCSINGAGCNYPGQDCFCRCMSAQCEYWAYYHWVPAGSGTAGNWEYSQTGAAGYEVKDGAVEGWSWGPGNFSSGTEPPKIAFADICKAAVVGGGSPAAGATGPANLLQYAGFAGAVVVLALAARFVTRRRTT